MLVADAGGFAGAEEKLCLSQSAATRQVQALERPITSVYSIASVGA